MDEKKWIRIRLKIKNHNQHGICSLRLQDRIIIGLTEIKANGSGRFRKTDGKLNWGHFRIQKKEISRVLYCTAHL